MKDKSLKMRRNKLEIKYEKKLEIEKKKMREQLNDNRNQIIEQENKKSQLRREIEDLLQQKEEIILNLQNLLPILDTIKLHFQIERVRKFKILLIRT